VLEGGERGHGDPAKRKTLFAGEELSIKRGGGNLPRQRCDSRRVGGSRTAKVSLLPEKIQLSKENFVRK